MSGPEVENRLLNAGAWTLIVLGLSGVAIAGGEAVSDIVSPDVSAWLALCVLSGATAAAGYVLKRAARMPPLPPRLPSNPAPPPEQDLPAAWRLPQEPPPPPRLPRITVVGLVMAIVGTLLAIPYDSYIESTLPGLPGDQLPTSGWQFGLWGLAFVVGVPSFVIGIDRLRRARRSVDRRGANWARLVIVIAAIGAFTWSAPICGQIGNGM